MIIGQIEAKRLFFLFFCRLTWRKAETIMEKVKYPCAVPSSKAEENRESGENPERSGSL